MQASKCKDHTQCGNGLWCNSGTCVSFQASSSSGAACKDHTQCGNGLWCNNGTCVPHVQQRNQAARETAPLPQQPQMPEAERKVLGMTPAEALGKAMVGKWKIDCLAAKEPETEYSLQGDTIRGVIRNIKGDIVQTSSIENSSANYLGSTGELHRFSYISTNTYNDVRRSNALVVVTDFNKRRTLSSTRISDGEVLIRDGVFVGNNKSTPYHVRCSN